MTQVLDHDVIAARYFFPRPQPPSQPYWLRQEGQPALCCGRDEQAWSAGAGKVLVFFHGNGEVVADYEGWFYERISRPLGLRAFMAEYRGYGGSGGRPQMGAMLRDVTRVHQSLGVEPGEVIVMGRSVGSIYAIEYAARFPSIAGLILESGIADVYERLRIRMSPQELGLASDEDLRAAVAARVDHEAKLGGYRGPFLAMHTRFDQLVDVSHAERNHAWAGGEDRELVIFSQGDHNSVYARNAQAYQAAMEHFVDAIR